jgi:hypothetical protein
MPAALTVQAVDMCVCVLTVQAVLSALAFPSTACGRCWWGLGERREGKGERLEEEEVEEEEGP